MTVREKAELIVKDIKKEQGTNPVVILSRLQRRNMLVFMDRNTIY